MKWNRIIENRIRISTLMATLLEHLGSNVSSKFHENRGILKPILRNRDMGVSYLIFHVNTQNMYIFKPPNVSALYYEFVNIYKKGEQSAV